MSDKDEELTLNEEENNSSDGDEQEPEAVQQEQGADGEEGREFGESESVDPILLLEKELLAEKDKHIRLYAEFENFRRRTARERIELIGTATADLMKEMLPILDDFERALESNNSATDIDAVKEGFKLLHSKMFKLLAGKGLKPIESKGQDFDPEMHEGIAQVPAPNEKEKGKVIDVVEKGYQLNEKIIRHPKVVVGT